MDPKDRQRLAILFILLVVLAVTFWMGRRSDDASSPVASVPADGGFVEELGESLIDVGIQAEPIERGSIATDASRRNPFQYGPEPSAVESETVGPDPIEVSEIGENPLPPPPPPPPPIPFSYSGYAVVGPAGEAMALLADNNEFFAVYQQEVLMGRYRIHTVTQGFVEIEDLEFGRRQRLPLVSQ